MSTRGTPLFGDRAAVETILYPELHATDVKEGKFFIHVPKPTASGLYLKSNSDLGWELTTLSGGAGGISFDHLTPGRVPYVSPDKDLIDSENLVFDGSILGPKNINLPETTASGIGVIRKNGQPFIHDFKHPTGDTATPIGHNLFIGENAGNFTMGMVATEDWHASYNVGAGAYVLSANTLGSYNSGLGYLTLLSNTTGRSNSAFGAFAMLLNLAGHENSAFGEGALRFNTTGSLNTAIGANSGRYIAGGSVGNRTSDTSLYLGAKTKALADGDNNEIVIGYNTTGYGSNSAVLGNSSITKTVLRPTTEWRGSGDTVVASVDASGIVTATGYKVGSNTGWSGTFTSGSGDTVTVSGGLIISVT